MEIDGQSRLRLQEKLNIFFAKIVGYRFESKFGEEICSRNQKWAADGGNPSRNHQLFSLFYVSIPSVYSSILTKCHVSHLMGT